MANSKFKWKVDEIPIGSNRGLLRREWPKAFYKNTGKNVCAKIECIDDYTPFLAKNATHSALTLWIADYSSRAKSFHWIPLKTKCTNLTEAKKLLENYLQSNPRLMPLDLQDGHEDAVVDVHEPVIQ